MCESFSSFFETLFSTTLNFNGTKTHNSGNIAGPWPQAASGGEEGGQPTPGPNGSEKPPGDGAESAARQSSTAADGHER